MQNREYFATHWIPAGLVLTFLGAFFTRLDAVAPRLSTSEPVVLGFLVAGGVLAGPLLLARRMRVRDLMASVALFAAFLGWIVWVSRTDWLCDPRPCENVPVGCAPPTLRIERTGMLPWLDTSSPGSC